MILGGQKIDGVTAQTIDSTLQELLAPGEHDKRRYAGPRLDVGGTIEGKGMTAVRHLAGLEGWGRTQFCPSGNLVRWRPIGAHL